MDERSSDGRFLFHSTRQLVAARVRKIEHVEAPQQVIGALGKLEFGHFGQPSKDISVSLGV